MRRITGVEFEPGPGSASGSYFPLSRARCSLTWSGSTKWQARRTRTSGREDRLQELGANPEWVVRQHDVQKWMQAGIRNLHALVAIARDDWMAAQAVLLHVQDLIEGPVRHVLATHLATRKGAGLAPVGEDGFQRAATAMPSGRR